MFFKILFYDWLQINAHTGIHQTYNELRLRSIRVAQSLLKNDHIQPRQTIGFLAKNCDDLLSTFFAAIYLACPILPFHPSLSTDEIVRILNKTKPKVLFCDPAAFDNCEEIIKKITWKMKVFTFDEDLDGMGPVSNLLLETGDESDFVWVILSENFRKFWQL